MSVIRETFEKGKGILQLTPTWVPRPFNRPGHRLRLDRDDTYAMGMDRGAIVERWFSSITHSETPGAGPYEGMSFVNVDDNPKNVVLFKDFIDELGSELIGSELMEAYGTWPMYSKFYDYEMPLFHHIHHSEEACKKVGVLPKYEHYFFPKQYNAQLGKMPVSYFGFDPSVTKAEVIERLRDYSTRDTRITELSRAYRIELDTGWYTPAGVVHAPGSLCTYEPQWNSDVMAIWENVVNGEIFHESDLNAYLPESDKHDIEKIFEVADWELNTCPDYRARFFHRPILEHESASCNQKWIVYGNDYVGAKELTVYPRQTVTIQDPCAYGCVIIQGNGKLGKFGCEAPTTIHYGDLTADEFFVSKTAAVKGVIITNESNYEPLVMLKHFGPDGHILPSSYKGSVK